MQWEPYYTPEQCLKRIEEWRGQLQMEKRSIVQRLVLLDCIVHYMQGTDKPPTHPEDPLKPPPGRTAASSGASGAFGPGPSHAPVTRASASTVRVPRVALLRAAGGAGGAVRGASAAASPGRGAGAPPPRRTTGTSGRRRDQS
ncbi:uncharacterized protein LOC113216379 [Frankliniella occidentalis]|uniref:Uncharacterized protein LOC113216379 n=1 Tax=Frankliniella occidentalis TaxID=133901 RepID=A0A6J1TM47_FRAOC|nr:uncharacterized protein LOC113216379 [Frankliniella occidentalis]